MSLFRLIVAVVLTGCVLGSSCQPDPATLLAGGERSAPDRPGMVLVARLVHVTDSHATDSLSPGRFAGAHDLVPTAWRAWESYSTQIFDGIIRTANRIHASGTTIDFLLHTGDACDNDQANELAWFTAIMDGGAVNPLSGPDDRQPDAKPATLLDPYATFEAQGVYQQGVHGDLPSIPWYGLMGNHDALAIGTFPITTDILGRVLAPLPLPIRPGLFLPRYLDPTGDVVYGPVSPANPGPPGLFETPVSVTPNEERAYLRPGQFVQALQAGSTQPPGHGFAASGDRPYYSVSPMPGLRLIGLYTSDIGFALHGLPYERGSISAAQIDWLRSELEAATAAGEMVIVATHHPSRRLETMYGSVVGPDEFRALLNQYPAVVLHLAGHEHENRVAVRDNYLEIETCSTIDWPQEARLIEIWRDSADGSVFVSYGMFSHVDDRWPALGDDPLWPLREQALSMAGGMSAATQRIISNGFKGKGIPRDPAKFAGSETDRQGVIRIR